MVASQPCPRCKDVLFHYKEKLEQLYGMFSKLDLLEKYKPYNSWSPKGKGNVTFTKHAFECPVCGKRWIEIE